MVPGRRFSTMTSAPWTSSRKSSLPSGALRFIASERLFRLSLMNGDDSPSRKGAESRAMQLADLDHVGPKVGQLHRAERPGHVDADLDDSDAGQRMVWNLVARSHPRPMNGI